MDTKRYKIVITEFTTERSMQNRRWEKGADINNGEDGYGYAPEVEVTKEIERDVLIQHLPEINLSTIIKAINDLS
jgi:hypothetical protein